MNAVPASFRLAPETLHPALWLGHQFGRTGADAVSTGFPELDAELPGGGWPRRALSECLLAHPGVGEVRLLAPAIVAAQRADRLAMLFDPPADLSARALGSIGIDAAQLLVITSGGGAASRDGQPASGDSLWALEQALKSGHVGAVVAWLPPRTPTERMRRLQLAASRHDGAAFVLREPAAAVRPSPAPLRVLLEPGGADRLRLRVLKRRGPPLESPLQLELPAVLSPVARRRAETGAGRVPAPLRAATFVDLAA